MFNRIGTFNLLFRCRTTNAHLVLSSAQEELDRTGPPLAGRIYDRLWVGTAIDAKLQMKALESIGRPEAVRRIVVDYLKKCGMLSSKSEYISQ